MSTSTFKGAIQGGSISAVLQSDLSNQDADLLVAAYSPLGPGSSRVDHRASAPGGRAEVRVDALDCGVLEVWVAIGAEADRGTLQVLREGVLHHEEEIVGSVRWVYSVETP